MCWTLTAVLNLEIKARLSDNGLAVACIGSPIGKVKIDEPFEPHMDRFKIAVDAARFFGAPLIRIFSTIHPTVVTSTNIAMK